MSKFDWNKECKFLRKRNGINKFKMVKTHCLHAKKPFLSERGNTNADGKRCQKKYFY